MQELTFQIVIKAPFIACDLKEALRNYHNDEFDCRLGGRKSSFAPYLSSACQLLLLPFRTPLALSKTKKNYGKAE